MAQPPSTLYCSFCGKAQYEVLVLIAGPTVFICNECVALCTEYVHTHAQNRALDLPPPTRVQKLVMGVVQYHRVIERTRLMVAVGSQCEAESIGFITSRSDTCYALIDNAVENGYIRVVYIDDTPYYMACTAKITLEPSS